MGSEESTKFEDDSSIISEDNPVGVEDKVNEFLEFLDSYRSKLEFSESDVNVPGIIISGRKGNFRDYFCKSIPVMLNESHKVIKARNIVDADDVEEEFRSVMEDSLKGNLDSVVILDLDPVTSRSKWEIIFYDVLRDYIEKDISIYMTCEDLREFDKDRNPLKLSFNSFNVDEISSNERNNIFSKYMIDNCLSEGVEGKIENLTNGMTRRDIDSFVNRLVFNSINNKGDVNINDESISKTVDEYAHLLPNEYNLINPDITYDDVGGLDSQIRKVKQVIDWPLRYEDMLDEYDCTTSKGILLYGPPGTGKTHLAKAIAGSSNNKLISVQCSEVFQKYMGESESRIREFFRIARNNKPSILFFDEFEAIGASRKHSSNSPTNSSVRRVVSQLLSELDGVDSDDMVKVIASTNMPDKIDNALLRSGRIDEMIEIPIPQDNETRLSIFNLKLKNKPVSDFDREELCEKMVGFTGGDIEKVCNRAALIRINKRMNGSSSHKINKEDILEAIEIVQEEEDGTDIDTRYLV